MKSALKYIYNIIPFKKAFFVFLRSCCKPSERIYQHLHFKGLFDVLYKGKKIFRLYHHGHIEENKIFWDGLENGWEPVSINIWIELCKIKTVIYDVGANTGLYGLTAKAINPQAEVHCFEPLNGVVKFLKQNNDINNFNIRIHQIALSDYDGNADVFLPDDKEFVYSVTVNQNTLDNKIKSRKISIPVSRIDTLIENNIIRIPDLVKLDVERHESDVLSGMGKYLSIARPDFIIEILDHEQAHKLNNIFNNLGYLYFNIDDKKRKIRKTDRIEKSDYWNYLICKPETAQKLNLIHA
ncbi:MAG: hypothetical protein Fur0041_03230 [Bacteroidia bacterium]